MQETAFLLHLSRCDGVEMALPSIRVHVAPSPHPFSVELWHGLHQLQPASSSLVQSGTSQAVFKLCEAAGKEVCFYSQVISIFGKATDKKA